MLALSLLELVFGLLINCTVSDKTSNCASVAAVSGTRGLVNSEWGAKQEPGVKVAFQKHYISWSSGFDVLIFPPPFLLLQT